MDATESRIVALDPHPIWLDNICVVLRNVGLEVAVATTVPEEALGAIAELEPALFVLDPSGGEPAGTWLGIVEQALALDPELKVIALSARGETDAIEAAFAAGAAAYVVKTADEGDIDAALHLVMTNAIHLASGAPAAVGGRAQPDERALTRREFEILQLVAEGHANAAIGRKLWVTEQTVKFHLSNVYRKIGVENRTAAARWAELHGVSPLETVEDTGLAAGSAA